MLQNFIKATCFFKLKQFVVYVGNMLENLLPLVLIKLSWLKQYLKKE